MGSTPNAARPLLVVALLVLSAGVVAAVVVPPQASASVVTEVAGRIERDVRPLVTSAAVVVDVTATAVTPPTPTTTAPPEVPPPPAPAAPVPTTAAPAPQPAPTAQTTAPPATSPPTTAPPATAPPTTVAPPPARTTEADVDLGCERYLFDLTNRTRVEHGLPALAFDGRAHGVARGWSREMAARQRMTHNPNYGDQLTAAGVAWRTAGENVGRGQVEDMFGLWMASPTHRANILDDRFGAFAVACVTDGTQVWVTQNFWG